MRLNELIRSYNVWVSNEERELFDKITEPTLYESFNERQKTIIESLVRKSLLIKVNGKHSTYIYPNI